MKPFENSFWYQQRSMKVMSNSDALVADLAAQSKAVIKPTMNTVAYSATRYVVGKETPQVPIELYQLNADGSPKDLTSLELYKILQRGLRLPVNAFSSGGSDATICIEDTEDDSYADLYGFSRLPDGKYRCKWGGVIFQASGSDGIFRVVNNEKHGAAATSLPFGPGMITTEDLERGYINHMMRISLASLSKVYKYPALRTDGNAINNTGIIDYGQIFKLKPDTSLLSTMTPLARMITIAGMVHGFIVSDKSTCVTMYAEDYRPHRKLSPFTPLLVGLPLSTTMSQIPWGNAQAVEF